MILSKRLLLLQMLTGGELFIGIEDDNMVTGLPYPDDKNSGILKAPENNVLKVAYFSVKKGSKYVYLTSKGECFQRKNRESVPTTSESIRFAKKEKISREYDRQFIDQC